MARQSVRKSAWPSNWGNPSEHWHYPWLWLCRGCWEHETFPNWRSAMRHADNHPATCPGEWR